MPRVTVCDAVRRGALGALIAIAAAAASAPTDAHAARLVGQAAKSRVFVAVVSDGQSLLAYACDGRGISQWFRGTISDRVASIRNPAGARLAIRFANGGATGTVKLRSGRLLRFAVSPARGRAGLFRRAEKRFRSRAAEARLTGWVRLNDGRVRGLAQRTVSGTTVLSPPSGLPPATTLVAGAALLPDCSLPAPSRLNPLTIRPPAVQLCRLDLPPRVAPTTATSVPALPPAVGIDAQAATRLPVDAEARLEQRLRQAGILPLLPPQLESAFLAYESALRDNPTLKAAGARLADSLRARDAAGVSSRLAEIRAALGKASISGPDTTMSRLARGTSLTLLSAAPDRFFRALTNRVVLRGPNFVAVTRTENASGSHAFAGTDVSAGVQLFSRASGQDATASAIASTVFDVPANVAEVEVKTVGWDIDSWADYMCNFGWAAAYWAADAWVSKQVTAANPHPPAVTEALSGESPGEVCPLIPAAPVPNPRPLDGPDPEVTMRFRPESVGGRYQLFFFTFSAASGAGLTFSWADAAAVLDRVEVTFDR